MEKLKGACLFGLSGGPTAVINASALGVIKEALHSEDITNVYALHHGVKGILNEEFFDMSLEDEDELEKLFYTPAAIFGSVRYKLKDISQDVSEYEKILEVFEKYDIRYFFYIGGNDSMDTCNKISKFFKDHHFKCRIIGIPKTIDNDLAETDHSPGYGSAAKYVAQSIIEVKRDMMAYNKKSVLIFEIMGRNAGWLTAASSLASITGYGPDLLFLPERPIQLADFCEKVIEKLQNQDIVVVAVSEGIKEDNGKYLIENYEHTSSDSFGHMQLGGVGDFLNKALLMYSKGFRVRTIEFSLLQRCASHAGSLTDATEAYEVGKYAVKKALEGYTDKMAIIKRKNSPNYEVDYSLTEISLLANYEKKLPISWIKDDFSGMTQEFYDYALPLLEGETQVKYKNGLPDFANLKLIYVPKK